MKEVSKTITYNGKNYKIVFNLNVLEAIQEKYGTVEAWGELTDGKRKDENGNKIKGEVDLSALIFGFTEALNEGIDIDNETRSEKEPFFTRKQVARIISAIGQETATEELNDLVIDSSKDKNAEKNS